MECFFNGTVTKIVAHVTWGSGFCFDLSVVYDNNWVCMWVLVAGNGMCCATHACDECRRTPYSIPVLYVWVFAVYWCGARQHLDMLPDLLCICCIWKATCRMTDRPDTELSTAWLQMIWTTDFFLACCVQTLTFPFHHCHFFPVLNCPDSLNTHRLEHASLQKLYSSVCLSSCRELIHSCIGHPALTVADLVMSHYQKNVYI